MMYFWHLQHCFTSAPKPIIFHRENASSSSFLAAASSPSLMAAMMASSLSIALPNRSTHWACFFNSCE